MTNFTPPIKNGTLFPWISGLLLDLINQSPGYFDEVFVVQVVTVDVKLSFCCFALKKFI